MFCLDKLIPAKDKNLFAVFSLAFMAYISFWAILHDQIIIRIEPRHFTEYHRQLLDLSNHTLLAVQYGFIATFGLGITFGMLTYFASQSGHLVRMPFKGVLIRFIVLSLVIEIACLMLGYLQYRHYGSNRSHLFYPESIFPDQTLGIAVTQTMNVSAYLFAAFGSLLFWAYIYQWRKQAESTKFK